MKNYYYFNFEWNFLTYIEIVNIYRWEGVKNGTGVNMGIPPQVAMGGAGGRTVPLVDMR